MALTYTLAVKSARMNAIITEIGASGKLEIGTTGMATILATITLNATAGTVSNGVLTFSGMPKTASATAAGIAAAARIRKSDNTDIITGLSVGVSASDVIIDNTNVALNQNVNVTSFVITHAA